MPNRVVITGGTDGIGKATAHLLAQRGARILLVGRNKSKGEAAVSEIVEASGNTNVEFLSADLSLVAEARRVVQHVKKTFDRLDVLIPAAGGGFPSTRTLTAEGIEQNFALQYLTRFVLINELLPLLQASPSPQVLIIAGAANYRELDFDNLQREKKYGGKFSVIFSCATLNYLLTLGMQSRRPKVAFYNYDSGPVRTATMWGDSKLAKLVFATVGRLFTRSPEQAANEILKLLTEDVFAKGGFYVASLKKQDAPAEDEIRCDQLWEYSQGLLTKLSTEKD